jgi:hypothetical protein
MDVVRISGMRTSRLVTAHLVDVKMKVEIAQKFPPSGIDGQILVFPTDATRGADNFQIEN